MSKFKVGDKAWKPKGYKFPCTIVSVFKTTSGDVRIVGELDDYKMLHIFNEKQLEHVGLDQEEMIEKNEEILATSQNYKPNNL